MIVAYIDEAVPEKITLSGVPLNYKELCQTVPGLLWDRKADNLWRAPLGFAIYLAIRETFGSAVTFDQSVLDWVEADYVARRGPAMALRAAVSAEGDQSLYPHQRAGVAFLKVAKRAILCDDLGLGKTRQAATALMEHYMDDRDPFPTLIICPNSTKTSWKREIETVWPGLEVVVVSGTATQRKKQLSTPAHVYVMNFEAVRTHSRLASYGSVAFRKCVECGGQDEKVSVASCHTHMKELNSINFNAVIVDEAHRMKSPDSQTTRAIKYATGDADIRIAMTGTPIANSPDDLWSILNWISPDEYPTYSKFLKHYLDVSFDIYGATHVTGIKPGKKDEFFEALDPRLRRMSKDMVMSNLPPIIRESRFIQMPPKQKKAYEQMRDMMLAEIDDEVLAVTSPMVKTMRMLQFASAYAETTVTPQEDGTNKVDITLAMPSNKVEAFMSDIADFGDNQVVVFAASRQLIELLSAKMTTAKIPHGLITGKVGVDERQEYMDEFQKGNLQFVLCTVQAGGTGITLTAANTAVFLQRPWSMIDSKQSEGRVHRIGSEIHESVTIIDYVSEGTVDEAVIKAVYDKSNRLEEILRDKELLRKLLDDPNSIG